MVQATTPTYVLTLPVSINLNNAIENSVVFSLTQNSAQIHKVISSDNLHGNVLHVFLEQSETLPFYKGTGEMQVNWLEPDGDRIRRRSTKIKTVQIEENLYKRVIE